MFTGIIEEIGRIKNIKNGAVSSVITIEAHTVTADTKPGDSIAVNGVCLTAVKVSDSFFSADVMGETMRRSNLKFLKPGDLVNLERAVKAGGRFGGHIVSGHVDGLATIVNYKKEDIAVWTDISADLNIMKFIVAKGSVALDGISLTAAYVNDEFFSVSIIPHTGLETTLLNKNIGDKINIECDIIGKYVEKLLFYEKKEKPAGSEINIGFLAENGFL